MLASATSLPRIEALPSPLPNNWNVINFRAKADQLHSWLFHNQSDQIFFNNTATSTFYNGSIVSVPSYLGQTFPATGTGEGLATLGVMYNGALLGKLGDFGGADPNFMAIYTDTNGIAWNNA